VRVLEFLGIVLAAGAPWIVAIVYFGRKVRGDGWVAPSMGERLRDRLLR
jgi:hypothetical protein